MNSFLQAVDSHNFLIHEFFAKDIASLTRDLLRLESEIDDDATPVPNDRFHHELIEILSKSFQACGRIDAQLSDKPELLEQVQRRFREETDPWFKKSWFANRSRTKPSGFPGDFEMLRMLYQQDHPPTPARGLGGYLDLCLMVTQLANAVRGRLKNAKDFLLNEIESRTGDIRILDIASGPCREYMEWPTFGKGRHIEVLAMDSDPLALEFVDNHVANKLDETELKTVRHNALRTRSASANRRRFGTFDIIYSVGLCDYLPDNLLIEMLAAWRQTLNEDGVLYIAFKDCERYDKIVYQWHLDWFFFQRTEQDMIDLFGAAGFNLKAMKQTRDETGIIINFVNRASEQPILRIDSEETRRVRRKQRVTEKR